RSLIVEICNRYALTPPAVEVSAPEPAHVRPVPALHLQGEYTDEARLAGLEGIVLISGDRTADGTIANPRILQGLGLGLDEKSMELVSTLHLDLDSSESSVVIAVEFGLPDKQSRWHLVAAAFDAPVDAKRP